MLQKTWLNRFSSSSRWVNFSTLGIAQRWKMTQAVFDLKGFVVEHPGTLIGRDVSHDIGNSPFEFP